MEQLIVEETIADILHNIAFRMLANNAQVNSRGLFNGKMGMAIFLYHYGNRYNNAACTQLADGFIEDLRDNIIEITSVEYNNGLSGIDAGLKYLLNKGFIDAGMATIPEMAEQAIYKSVLDLRPDNIHENFYRLPGLIKYFTLDHRKNLLTTTGSFPNTNRKCISHIIDLLGRLDVQLIPHLDYRDVLGLVDALSRIYYTWFGTKDMRQFISYGLRKLEAMLFDNTDGIPIFAGCNPFCLVLALLQIFDRTNIPNLATYAIRILEKYETAGNELYLVKDLTDAGLLQHAIACKKLRAVLKDDRFGNYAAEWLNIYRERKNNSDNILKHRLHDNFSLHSGSAGEGMALLTLEGHVPVDWFEDLMECCLSHN